MKTLTCFKKGEVSMVMHRTHLSASADEEKSAGEPAFGEAHNLTISEAPLTGFIEVDEDWAPPMRSDAEAAHADQSNGNPYAIYLVNMSDALVTDATVAETGQKILPPAPIGRTCADSYLECVASFSYKLLGKVGCKDAKFHLYVFATLDGRRVRSKIPQLVVPACTKPGMCFGVAFGS
jgi:hypothetical protein